MKRVLICTIMRNQSGNVQRWASQLAGLIDTIGDEYEAQVSVYENDSVDHTAEAAVNAAHKWLPNTKLHFASEHLNTKYYGSVWSLDRIRNLANARQKCLDQVGDHLGDFTKIAYIEPDVSYDPKWCSELILARHPAAANIIPHIYSGWSLRSLNNPKESVYLYDTCATRQRPIDTEWSFNAADWATQSLIPTDLGGPNGNCLHYVWSTFNCFCVYDAAPFKQPHPQDNVSWGWVNRRLRTGQEYIDGGDYGSGWLDCDTAVICEDFRAKGFGNILLNTNCLVRHGECSIDTLLRQDWTDFR